MQVADKHEKMFNLVLIKERPQLDAISHSSDWRGEMKMYDKGRY